MSSCPECDAWLAELILEFIFEVGKALAVLCIVAAIVIPLAVLIDKVTK